MRKKEIQLKSVSQLDAFSVPFNNRRGGWRAKIRRCQKAKPAGRPNNSRTTGTSSPSYIMNGPRVARNHQVVNGGNGNQRRDRIAQKRDFCCSQPPRLWIPKSFLKNILTDHQRAVFFSLGLHLYLSSRVTNVDGLSVTEFSEKTYFAYFRDQRILYVFFIYQKTLYRCL